MKKKILIMVLLLLIMAFVGFKFTSFVIFDSFSRVSIDEGIKVIYTGFDESSTTDFLRMNDSELENISGLILEKENYGKIVFFEDINLTENVVENEVDIDSNVEISSNFIEVDSDVLTSLNKSAVLYLYGLSFSNPRILKNGEVCSSNICNRISYSGGILEFSISEFSNYSAEETPVIDTGSITGGGSGGGEGISGGNFYVDKNLIKIEIKQGDSKREVLEMMNVGEGVLNISIELGNLSRFMIISEDSFLLEKNKVKSVNLDIFARDNEVPDIYLGRIIISGNGVKKVVNVILDVKAKKPLFDVKTEVLKNRVNPGGEIEANITIINMGDLGNIDLLLHYSIKNFGNEVMLFREESLAIGKQISVIRKFKIPADFPYDSYIFYSRASYEDISAASADMFDIKKSLMTKLGELRYYRELVIGLLVLILFVLLIIAYLVYKKFTRWLFLKKKIYQFETLNKK